MVPLALPGWGHCFVGLTSWARCGIMCLPALPGPPTKRGTLMATDLEMILGALNARCVECGRVFDLLNETDADEWAYGHDCETS